MQTTKEVLIPVPTRAKESTAKALGRLARAHRPRLTLSEYVRQVLEDHVQSKRQESAA